MPKSNVIVIGGGAAGIMAAYRAGQLGAKVTILEKTSRLGTKILISGGGKCNVAHDGPLEEVLRAFRKNETQFIRPACYRLTNRQIVSMMTDRGLNVYTRPDGRVFPLDQTAKDVLAILVGYLEESGVSVQLDTPVVGIEAVDGRVTGVHTGEPPEAHSGYRMRKAERKQFWPADRVILATGGSSYPNCGTTGDGWDWARDLGHSIVPVRASLAPIYLNLEPSRVEFSGVALRDVVVRARHVGKEIARWRGDLLFTHQGVSGPTALGISRVVAEFLPGGEVSLEADILPDLKHEEVLARLQSVSPRSRVLPVVSEHMAERLAAALVSDIGVEPDRTFAQLDRKSRNRLGEALKGWKLGVVRTVPLEKGECVAGGIALDEVDPQTLESRKVGGLFICGEVLDIAGPVGGYNLQAAFATGYVAGESATR